MEKRDLIILRPGEESDFSLIFSTWLKGLKYANSWFNEIESNSYFKHYQGVIETILNSGETTLTVAALKDSEDVVLGYSVTRLPNILHWVYVKPAWRGIGLARDLVPTTIQIVTHLTNVGRSIKPASVAFDPFAI